MFMTLKNIALLTALRTQYESGMALKIDLHKKNWSFKWGNE